MFYGLGDGETYNYKKHDEYYSNSCQKFYSKYLTSPFDVVWDTSMLWRTIHQNTKKNQV